MINKEFKIKQIAQTFIIVVTFDFKISDRKNCHYVLTPRNVTILVFSRMRSIAIQNPFFPDQELRRTFSTVNFQEMPYLQTSFSKPLINFSSK